MLETRIALWHRETVEAQVEVPQEGVSLTDHLYTPQLLTVTHTPGPGDRPVSQLNVEPIAQKVPVMLRARKGRLHGGVLLRDNPPTVI